MNKQTAGRIVCNTAVDFPVLTLDLVLHFQRPHGTIIPYSYKNLLNVVTLLEGFLNNYF